MNEFELSLANALRDEAKEISMRTDQQQAANELRVRLDRADRTRRRRHFAYAAGAAAAAVLVLVAVVVTSRQASPTDGAGPAAPDESGAAPSFTATFLQPPLHATLPSWTEHADAQRNGASELFEESSCAGLYGASPCSDDADLKLRILTPFYFYPPGSLTTIEHPSYAEYVAAWDALESSGTATISDRSSATVGGRPATVMSLKVQEDAPGAIACPTATSSAVSQCAPLIAGRAVRVAIVDQGADAAPTVFYISLNGDAADRASRFAEFDTMLSTVGFD